MAMFVRVVECGSFAAAAEASGVSAAMAAKHVRTIEQRLGARLLHRTTRRQQLTEVGTLYLDRCRTALANVELAESSALELQSVPRGRLNIVAPSGFGSQALVPALVDYMARYPDVDVELTLDNSPEDLVGHGHELGIVMGDIHDTALVARPLDAYRRIMAAAPAYLATRGCPEHPRDLIDHDCLGLSYWRHHDRWHLFDADGQSWEVRVRGRFKSNQGTALQRAALCGAGIVLQPEQALAPDIAAGHLRHVLPAWSYQPSPTHLIYAQDGRPTAKLRSAIDFLVERFSAGMR